MALYGWEVQHSSSNTESMYTTAHRRIDRMDERDSRQQSIYEG